MNNLNRTVGLIRLQNFAHIFESTPKICGGDHHSPPNTRRRKTLEAGLCDQEVNNLLAQLDKWKKPTHGSA
jgi:hypothetical protein